MGPADQDVATRRAKVLVAELAAADLPAAVEVLARAFRDNPLNRAVVGRGEARRLRCNQYGMRTSLKIAGPTATILGGRMVENGGNSLQFESDAPQGVLLAIRPRHFPLPAQSLLAQLQAVLGQGLRVARRWGEVYRALEAVHPPRDHWYLSLLGTDPAVQGNGIGRSLLKFWLAGVDRDGAASYLETDREENVGFYAREGFAVEFELRVLGTRVWCMRRAGQRSDGRQETA